jgi:hypothetical protein
MAHKMRQLPGKLVGEGKSLNENSLPQERRKWPRLPLAIPIFVRSRDDKGKDVLEFATAMNVSAGGLLVAVRRSLPDSTQVMLEIPTAPSLAANVRSQATRNLKARTVRVIHAEGYHLIGLKFARPLAEVNGNNRSGRRKVPSTV